MTNDIFAIDTKIGVVDFRNILKESKTMKKLGKEFLKFDKLLNTKIKKKQLSLQDEQKKLIDNKIKKKNNRISKVFFYRKEKT